MESQNRVEVEIRRLLVPYFVSWNKFSLHTTKQISFACEVSWCKFVTKNINSLFILLVLC